ncbi:MAG: hypothetical protein NT166_08115 [Candidatus Aminicenantes bacterium]|nr:hypothetical protein [Candidatus Aminicenantes bacterium]
MKIKTINLLLFICIILVTANGFSEDDSTVEWPGAFFFDLSLANRLPGGNFFPFIIENYAPDATSLIEESNGFSLIDNPRVYFEGDSFTNFNWFYNGFNLNSSLNDGSPAVILPFSSVAAFRLQGESPLSKDNGMNFISGMPRGSFSRLTLSSVYTDLGGYWMKFMIQPSHPSERADRLYNERRKINSNYFIDYQWAKHFAKSASQLTFSANYYDIKRQFNDFNRFDATFREDGKLLLLHTRFRKELTRGFYELFGVFNLLDRSHQGAEIAAYPQETTDRKRYSIMTGAHLKKKNADLKISLLHENEQATPYVKNFSKDLVDTDGDSFLPFYTFNKLGTFSATTLNANLNIPFQFSMLGRGARADFFADARYSQLSGKEKIHDYNSVAFAGEPYLAAVWNPGQNYKNTNADARVGIHMTWDVSANISLLAKLLFQYNHLAFDTAANNLNFLSPGFDVGVLLFKNKKTKVLVAYGQTPYDLRENVNTFLETRGAYGTLYRWQDANGDKIYQPGEESGIYGYTGGRYHFLDKDASAPIKQRLLVHFSTPLSKRYMLNIKALYKRIKNNLRVRFDDYRDYGFFEAHDGYNLFFFDQPFKNYYLTNNYLEKDPFYAQFLINVEGGKKDKWFFSFSFMAHMGMGDTAFGNGPGSNDIGLLAESQANPNSWINGFGRVDGDRGFVAKTYFGFNLTRKLSLGVSLKYRDGDPFAFINALSGHDQWVLYYKTIKAENEKGIKGGPREDYIGDISVRLNYNFKILNKEAVISLTFFNLPDIGGELSEYVFSGGSRDAVELQVPRSLRLTFDWKF